LGLRLCRGPDGLGRRGSGGLIRRGYGWRRRKSVFGRASVRHRRGVEQFRALLGQFCNIARDEKAAQEHRERGAFREKGLHGEQVCAVPRSMRPPSQVASRKSALVVRVVSGAGFQPASVAG
jgi:hypothetical protein